MWTMCGWFFPVQHLPCNQEGETHTLTLPLQLRVFNIINTEKPPVHKSFGRCFSLVSIHLHGSDGVWVSAHIALTSVMRWRCFASAKWHDGERLAFHFGFDWHCICCLHISTDCMRSRITCVCMSDDNGNDGTVRQWWPATMLGCSGKEMTVIFVKHSTERSHSGSYLLSRQSWQFIVHHRATMHGCALIQRFFHHSHASGHYSTATWQMFRCAATISGAVTVFASNFSPLLFKQPYFQRVCSCCALARNARQTKIDCITFDIGRQARSRKIYAGKLNVPKCQRSVAILLFKSCQFVFFPPSDHFASFSVGGVPNYLRHLMGFVFAGSQRIELDVEITQQIHRPFQHRPFSGAKWWRGQRPSEQESCQSRIGHGMVHAFHR